MVTPDHRGRFLLPKKIFSVFPCKKDTLCNCAPCHSWTHVASCPVFWLCALSARSVRRYRAGFLFTPVKERKVATPKEANTPHLLGRPLRQKLAGARHQRPPQMPSNRRACRAQSARDLPRRWEVSPVRRRRRPRDRSHHQSTQWWHAPPGQPPSPLQAVQRREKQLRRPRSNALQMRPARP